MQFKLRNNTEAITGFIQGIIMEYDYANQFLHYFRAMEVKVDFQDNMTLVTILTWTNDDEYLPEQSIGLLADATTEYLHKQTVEACEQIHNDYVQFFKR